MSGKSIVIKLVAGILAIGILIGAIWLLSGKEEKEEEIKLTVFETDAEKISALSVSGEEAFTLKKEEGDWVMEGMEGVGVNQSYASALAKSLSEITSTMLVSSGKDISPYGFDKPLLEIAILTQNGEELIKIGEQSGEYHYVNVYDKDVYIVNSQDLYMAFMGKFDYLDTKLDWAVENAERVKIGSIELLKKDGEWHQVSPYDRIADASKVKPLLESMSLSAEEILPLKEKEADLRKMEKTSVFVDEQSFDVYTGNKECYVVTEEGSYAYKLSGTPAFIYAEGFDLIVKNLAPISITEVSEIVINYNKRETILTIEAPGSEAPIFYKNGRQAIDESFRSFYQSLMMLSFKGEGTASGAESCSVLITLESGETTDIRFISANDMDYAVSINGKTQFTISKKSVDDTLSQARKIGEV